MPSKPSKLILGFDPGLTRCGYGVVSHGSSRQVTFESVGVIKAALGGEQSSRIAIVGDQVAELLDSLKPNQVAIERVFAQQNLHSVMGVAQISGVISYLCHLRGIPITFYTPTEVKAAVTGSGRANKQQVTKMVMQILKLKEQPKPADAADALAIAITCAWRGGIVLPEASSTETGAQKKWRSAIAASKKS